MTIPAPLGPRPAPTGRPSVAALRVLECLAEASEPLTVSGLTQRLGGHQNTVRLHLERLLRDGFAEEQRTTALGRGRPARVYVISADGRQVAGVDPGTLEQGALMAALVDQLLEDIDPAAAAVAFGRRWGRRLDSTPPGASVEDSLLGTLTRQGFAPAVTEEGLELRTCPLVHEARAHPEVVCGIHAGMIREVAGEELHLIPFARPGACLVVPTELG